MAKAMIVSVGGSPQPIVLALKEESPRFVCFFVSQRSVEEIAEIKRQAALEFADYKVITDDPQDLIVCYRHAVRCIEQVLRQGIPAEDTMVDYTGGTKVMSAALAMAAASHGVRFSYVGGDRRTKSGLGVVETGSEQRRIQHNPWQLFAVEERRRIAQYFNGHQYVAAATALAAVLPRLSEPDRSFADALAAVTQGYAAWDRFEHETALARLSNGRQRLKERVTVASESRYDELLAGVAGHVHFLGELKGQTQGFKRPHQNLAGDLVANAERRIDESKFDDAVARLYRALELVGQAAFERVVGVPTGEVPPDKLPPTLRDDFVRRYGDSGSGTLKLPLAASYGVLAELGDEWGERYRQFEDELRKVLDTRNHSILAHGFRPVAESTARRMLEIAVGFLPQGVVRPAFPRLPW